MTKSLGMGLQITARRWYVVLLLHACLLGPALVFGGLSWTRLLTALQNSLAGRSLLKDLDANLMVDLAMHRGDILASIPIGGLLIAAATVLLWIWLNGVVVAAVSDSTDMGEAFRRGAALFSRFAGLWVVTIVVVASILTVAGFAGGWLLKRLAESNDEMTPYWVLGTCGGLAGLLVFVAIVIHDQARIRSAATDATSLEAYRWSLRFCLRECRRVFLLALAVNFVGLLIWISYQCVAMLVTPTATPGIVISALLGQLLMLSRAAGRVWYFAAASDLQARASVAWSHVPVSSEPMLD